VNSTTDTTHIRTTHATKARPDVAIAGPTTASAARAEAASVHRPASAAMQASSRQRAAAHGAHAAQLALGNAVLKVGSRGPHVKALQEQLNEHGAHLATDGVFGPLTEGAVKSYQSSHGLTSDGVVGPHTRHALETNAKAVHHSSPVSNGQFNTNTVQGCAQALLHSPNVTFWSALSTGSDRQNFQRLADGEQAHVFATNKTGPSNVTPSLKMMQALVAMSQKGSIQINALTGGTHSFNSNHYSGHAVDLSVFGLTQPDRPLGAHHLPMLSLSQMEQIAGQFGGVKNFETSHAHFDF
jgi:peptidoglycan hydrolase-like protein with peptidoglycan-binding domain